MSTSIVAERCPRCSYPRDTFDDRCGYCQWPLFDPGVECVCGLLNLRRAEKCDQCKRAL